MKEKQINVRSGEKQKVNLGILIVGSVERNDSIGTLHYTLADV